jgi:hypothetical protein
VGCEAVEQLLEDGGAFLAGGCRVLGVQAFVRFVMEGVGTPAPVAPTQRLVIGGPYRYVRNPMYLVVTAVIVGQALALGQPTSPAALDRSAPPSPPGAHLGLAGESPGPWHRRGRSVVRLDSSASATACVHARRPRSGPRQPTCPS